MRTMRRVLCTLLLCAILASALFLFGCDALTPTAEDACVQFLELIRTGNYAQAYDMLHSSVRYDESHYQSDLEAAKKKRQDELDALRERGESTVELEAAELVVTPSKKRISLERFVERYTNIFQELEITDAAYQITNRVEGDAICVYDYTLSYESPLLADESLAYRMSVRREQGRWTIEWAPNLIHPEMEWGDTVAVGKTTARRGEILADGMLFAQTVDAVSLLAFPLRIGDLDHFARQVSALTDLSIPAVIKMVESTKGDFTILTQYYPDAFTESLEQQLLQIEGISIDKSNFGTLRNYPQKDMLAHLIGYVGPITPEELVSMTGSEDGNALYNVDSRIGKSGLEKVYEQQLRGKDGWHISIHTEDGRNKVKLYEEPALNGLDIQLSLNAELQEQVDKLLRYSLYGEHTAGVVIVMDPTTGKLEALSAWPSYDLNLFSRGMSELEWTALSTQANTPMFNRFTQGRYPPGSIFKPFTAAAALESGAMSPETVFPDGRSERIMIDGERETWLPSDSGEFGPWTGAMITRVYVRSRRNPLHMTHGMMYSDNIYFAYAALRTGINSFTEFTDRLGLNESIPFDVSVNAAQMKNAKSEWRNMLLAESAYGQGEVLVTPLQAASLFSALANHGSIMQPYMVEGLYRQEGTAYTLEEQTQPTVWKQNVIQQSSLDILEPMLEKVITEGTGYQLRLANIAGKTGTAEIGGDKQREIVWFAGYRLRAEEPRLVLVMLEIPANDSGLSAMRFQIARTLLQ